MSDTTAETQECAEKVPRALRGTRSGSEFHVSADLYPFIRLAAGMASWGVLREE